MDNGVSVDITYALKENIGDGGIAIEELKGIYPQLKEVKDKLIKECNEGKNVFLKIPEDEKVVEEIIEFKEDIKGKFENLLVLGIGGSSLGAKSAIEALSMNARDERPLEIYFLDNIDPEPLVQILSSILSEKTLVNVVTKSGTTLETLFHFFIVKEWLKKSLGNNYKNHIIATTDPQKGYLRKVAATHGYHSFSIPPLLGGRYSVLSAVGLLPIALGGIDIKELMNGAQIAMEDFFKKDVSQCLSSVCAGLSFLFTEKRGYCIRVMMAYGNSLSSFVDWFLQLWAESLGKKKEENTHTGQTPLKAIGTTDQHSLLQLFIEGPKDKFISFLRVKNFRKDISVPDHNYIEDIEKSLKNRKASEIMDIEFRGTSASLAMEGRPSFTYVLDSVNPFNLGYLYYSFMVETALTGYLFGIDPFSQPGVELGKNLAHGLLGSVGFEKYRDKILSMERESRKFIIKG